MNFLQYLSVCAFWPVAPHTGHWWHINNGQVTLPLKSLRACDLKISSDSPLFLQNMHIKFFLVLLLLTHWFKLTRPEFLTDGSFALLFGWWREALLSESNCLNESNDDVGDEERFEFSNVDCCTLIGRSNELNWPESE